MTTRLAIEAASWKAVARLVLLLLYCAQVLPVANAETVEWRNVPISIVLNVGEERVLAFPYHVQVGVPPTLTPDVFRTQSTGGTALWLARRPFATERLQVRLLSTGHVMLFDVTAVEARKNQTGSAEPIRVVFLGSTGSADSPDVPAGPLGPVGLTRFAAQQLYAPARVLGDVPRIRRVPMGAPEVVSVYRNDEVIATPLGSWQGEGLYVTAVMLTHTGHRRLILDPRLLKGRFVSAAFQHNSLGPAGSRSDTTCVYLVTQDPFIASIFADPSSDGAHAAAADLRE